MSLLSSKSSVVFIILLAPLEYTGLLSGTLISSVWLLVCNAGVGFTASVWVTGLDLAPIGALGPGFRAGFCERVANFAETGGLFRVFPLDASHSASFALKAEYKLKH